MIILSATTDVLEVVLGGAITTNQARVVASWRDITTTAFTPGRTVGVTNSATPVSAAGAPAASTQRVIDLLNVYNSDTVAATVTIQFYDGSTRYVLWSGSLATLESLQYVEGAGWLKFSASGAPLAGSISAVNGTTAEITAVTAASVVTLSLPTALTFTGKTVTGGTFASPTLTTPVLGTPSSGNLVSCTGYPGTSALVTTGALNSGSITSGFGSIDVGADSITGGAISGTTGTFTGAVNGSSYFTGAGTNPGGLGGSRWVYDWFSGNHRQFGYGVDASTNGAWTWITQRSDGSNSVTPMSLTSTGLAVTGTLSSTSSASFNGAAGAGIDSGNNASVGQELRSDNASLFFRDAAPAVVIGRRSSDGELAPFYRSTTQVGNISVTTTATAYNTSSDGRLKTNVRDFTAEDSGRIIDGLRPRWFDWLSGVQGCVSFIAQEVNAVDPLLARIGAVTIGDNHPTVVARQWAIDGGKFTPIIIAELQALRNRVALLEAA